MIKTKAKQIALIAMMAASIEAGKWALMSLPNVEVVSLLCASYGFVFGIYGMCATYIFVIIEMFEWGFNTWVIAYLIYWPLISFVFLLLGQKKINNRFISTIAISLLTLFFGVLSSAIDTGLFMGTITWEKFSIMYVRGIVYYAIELVCNIILFLFVSVPVINFLENRIKPQFYTKKDIEISKNKNDML